METDSQKRIILVGLFFLILISFGSLYLYRGYKKTDIDLSEPDSKAPQSKKKEVINTQLADTADEKKHIYITCDDGPNFGSDIVMNIAALENIPVAFFCVGLQFTGENKRYFSKTWERMKTQPGVEIYNHGFTHALWNRYDFFYARPDTVIYDFNRAHDSAGYPNRLMRANGNNIWRLPKVNHDTYKRYNSAVDALTDKGYAIMGWDNEWFHYKMKLRQTPGQMVADCEQMFARNATFIPNNLVFLCHEQSFADAEDSAKFHQFIKLLKDKPEYQFEPVSRYPGLK